LIGKKEELEVIQKTKTVMYETNFEIIGRSGKEEER
jgi:hypothetical protein